MNGHARMAIDNLALAGNLVFDVDETMLVPGQDMKVFPGKIFRRQVDKQDKQYMELSFLTLHMRIYKCLTSLDNLQMKLQAYHQAHMVPSAVYNQNCIWYVYVDGCCSFKMQNSYKKYR